MAANATARKTASCTLIVLVRFTLRSLVPAIRDDQRIARRVWAGHLADGAPPLHLQFSQVALPPSPGEQPGIEAAERQVEDGRQVAVVAAAPLAERFVGP